MSNPNIPPHLDPNFFRNLHGSRFQDYLDVISDINSVVKSLKNFTGVPAHLNQSMIKSLEIYDTNKYLNSFALTSSLLERSNPVFAQDFLKQLSTQLYVSDSLKGILQSSLPLFKVQSNSLSNYLRNPVFDFYDLHTEITTDSEESAEQDVVIENVEFFEDPIDVDNSNQIIVVAPFKSVLDKVKDSNLDVLHWREFEELIAELLRKDGWCVDLQGGTKDGGADIIATMECKDIGLIKCIWQAKKYAITNKVKLPAIKELADTRHEFGATKAILVTTSFLTKGANDRVQRDRHVLGKKERDEVECWVSNIINL